jgi:homogentisate 1,2-dioxygenase
MAPAIPADAPRQDHPGGLRQTLRRPDKGSFERASGAELKPHRPEGTLAFMFETRFPQKVTAWE